MIEFDLLGAPELIEALLQASKVGFGTPMLVRIITKASKPMLERAKSLAPKKTGKLSRAFKIVRARVKRKGEAKIYLTNSWPTAHLIEKGTAARIIKTGKRKGVSTGRVFPQPFMLPAYLQTKDQVQREVLLVLSAELVKLGKRIYKRAVKGTLGKKARKALS